MEKRIRSAFLSLGIVFLLVAMFSVQMAAAHSCFDDLNDQTVRIEQSDFADNDGYDPRHLDIHPDILFSALPVVTLLISSLCPNLPDVPFRCAAVCISASSSRAPPA